VRAEAVDQMSTRGGAVIAPFTSPREPLFALSTNSPCAPAQDRSHRPV
jgi:hypothetical protein